MLVDLCERTAGFALFTLTAPILAGASLTTAILSRRSPFVAHLRVGHGGRPLWVWKIRTMWDSSPVRDSERGLVEYINREPSSAFKDPNDARIGHPFAMFCRRHSIDELPQFIHILCGQMSLIGPRPLTRGEITRHYGDRANILLSVKPGITGLWQIRGRSELSWDRRVALDLELLRERGWRLYTEIAARTIVAVFDGKGAW